MKHMRIPGAVLLALLLFLISAAGPAAPCTTAVVSGRHTPDGRPMLFKNRDTSSLDNIVMYFEDGDYDYIGVVSAGDSLGTHVWSGVNSAGFSIMNAVASNINLDDTTTVRDRDNGTFMKLALRTCADLADFERLLDTEARPLGVQANFGAIDARGGAAYYEAGHFSYEKFDANDPRHAPHGYIVRTNYSYTGKHDRGHGYIRWMTAETLFHDAAAAGGLTPAFIMRDVMRCTKHSLTGIDLRDQLPADGGQRAFVPFRDFIPRHSTASSTVIQGVREGESPGLSTMWTVLGFPFCSVAVPTWVAGGRELPKIARASSDGTSPLCSSALELKERCFPVKRGSGSDYLNLAAVMNWSGTGIYQQLRPLEDVILERTSGALDRFRERGISERGVRRFYSWLDTTVSAGYGERFGIDMFERGTD